MNSLDQNRSKHASDAVMTWATKDQDSKRKIESASKDLPSLLRVNGLPSVLLARKDDPVVKALIDWLTKEGNLPCSEVELKSKLNTDRSFYRNATSEAIVYAVWLKRWATASLKCDAKDEAS